MEQVKCTVPKALTKRIGLVLVMLVSLVLILVTQNISFGAEVVFVNAPRETWPKEKLTLGAELRFRFETLDNFYATGYGEDRPVGKKDDSIYLRGARVGVNCTPLEELRFSLWEYQANAWYLLVPLRDSGRYFKEIIR